MVPEPLQQNALFEDLAPPRASAVPTAGATPPPRAARRAPGAPTVLAAPADPPWEALRNALPPRLFLGTSSWHFPGWKDLVWDGDYAQPTLSRHGLRAYAQHPLLRSVSLDRSFYRPLTASQFAHYADQVPPGFRFVVKAPSLICDAQVRNDDGRATQPNPAFLDPRLATDLFVQPALEGLGNRVGALVFQISPLPYALLTDIDAVIARLAAFLRALPTLRAVAPDAILAVEVRDNSWLRPPFAQALREAGATYCLGLHPRLPPIQDQLPLLRALWPGPLVCRWNLNARHGAYGYAEAKGLYEPFDRLVDPDPATREVLARVIAGTTGQGQAAYVCINNKAEGSAPLSVLALAEEVRRQTGQ